MFSGYPVSKGENQKTSASQISLQIRKPQLAKFSSEEHSHLTHTSRQIQAHDLFNPQCLCERITLGSNKKISYNSEEQLLCCCICRRQPSTPSAACTPSKRNHVSPFL